MEFIPKNRHPAKVETAKPAPQKSEEKKSEEKKPEVNRPAESAPPQDAAPAPAPDTAPQIRTVPLRAPSNEVERDSGRIILSIPRGAYGDGERFTIGAYPPPAPKGAAAKPETPRGVADTRALGGGVYSLKDCIDIAVANHLPLQIAKKSLRLAEMRLFEARRNLLPSATLDYQQYHGRINDLMYTGRKQTIEGQQPIFHGGELYYTMKQSETNLEITRNDYNRIRNDLVLQVKKAYYTLAKAKNNFRIQEELSGEVNRILDMVTKESEGGLASKLEALNVSSQAGQVKYQLVSAEGDLSVAELILKQAMNVDPKAAIDVREGLEFKKAAVDYEKVISMAMVNRPEMKINALMIDYYNYGKRVARAKLWPKVDLLGSWGLAKEEYASQDEVGGSKQLYDNDPNQKLEQQWYAGLKIGVPFWGSSGEWSLTKEHWVPVVSSYRGTDATTMELKAKLFDNLASLSERQLSEVDYDKARQELTKVRQDILLEARESCFNYQKALIQSETAQNKVKYQTGDLEMVKLKRSLDEAQDSNVIDGMIKLAQEKFGLLQALADCRTALASINKAIGIEDYYKDE